MSLRRDRLGAFLLASFDPDPQGVDESRVAVGIGHAREISQGQFFDRLAFVNDRTIRRLLDALDRRVMALAARASALGPRHEDLFVGVVDLLDEARPWRIQLLEIS